MTRLMRMQKGAAMALIMFMLVAAVPLATDSSDAITLVTLKPTWKLASDMPSNLSQSAVVGDGDGLIYVMGGQKSESSAPVAECWVYDTSVDEWTQLADMNVAVRGAAVALGPEGKIYLFGGATSSSKTDLIQVYDPDTDAWTTESVVLDIAVWEAKAYYSETEDRFYIVGGEVGSTFGGSNTVQFAPGTLSYTSHYTDAASLLPYLRLGGCIVPAPNPDNFWYVGGATSDYETLGSYILEFDASTDTWGEITIIPEGVVACGAVRGTDGMYYLYGGATTAWNYGEGLDTGYCYNPYTNEWDEIPDMVQGTRYFGYAATPDGRIWAIGGNNGSEAGEMVPQVQYLKVLTATLSMPSSVMTGEAFPVQVSIKAPFANEERFSLQAYALDGSGVTYGHLTIDTAVANTFVFDMTIPVGSASGNFTMCLRNLFMVYPMYNYHQLPDMEVKFTVVAQAAVSEQIAELEAQIAALQAQMEEDDQDMANELAALQAELDAVKAQSTKLQSSVDTKSDSMLSYLTIVLLVVIIALVALMMVRRKP